MPTLSVEKELLFNHLGRKYTDDEFDELCFEFGVELDEITSEYEEAKKSSTVKLSKEEESKLSREVVYKIDVPANRYDLLCIEGLSRALKIFLGDSIEGADGGAIDYKIVGTPTITMTVMKENTDTIRPFVVCGVLRNITFTKERYNSFIDLQDQLHRNLCRQRTLVAIGTHDLDSVQPPFVYDARSPTSIEFVPLTPDDKSFTAKDLLQHYEEDPACKHLKPYVPIIKEAELYPVIVDSQNTVLSLPPIINGSKSKITLDTKNVFIECTATDLTKANIVLDTVVTMFSEYCETPFTCEPVQVNYVDGNNTVLESSYVTPKLSTRKEKATIQFCNSLIGIQLSPPEMLRLCNKVQLAPAQLLENDEVLEITVPPTRSDILHPVDIAEDIGIAYGYNNIVKKVPTTCTVGGEFTLNLVTDLLREEISRAGYTEVLTHGLCSIHDNYTALQRNPEKAKTQAVSLSNPANIEYEVIRTTLLPGLLKTLQHNKSQSFSLGFKLFEISDVVVQDNENVITDTIVGSKNVRKICAVYSGPTSGFEIIHGLVDRIMTLLEIAPMDHYAVSSRMQKDLKTFTREEQVRISREGYSYIIEEVSTTSENDPEVGTYFPGRAAKVVVQTPSSSTPIQVGTFGIIHPNVLSNFDIKYPSTCVELNLEEMM